MNANMNMYLCKTLLLNYEHRNKTITATGTLE